ncbi:MAG: exodeoxyribonuclease V subunit gamma [Candidatus Cloacimonetes bacterium]|nr:exodeoxyribonuclease V subunit gamma [Candidatus Cloacimonadota bacterium]
MPIDLSFSNQLPLLAKRLIENIRNFYASGADPFVAPRIVIPNVNLRIWLQIEIAKTQGVAFHLDFYFLEGALFDCISRLCPDQNYRSLNQDALRAFLLGTLKNTTLEADELLPLRNYFDSLKPVDSVDYAKRLWQVADSLANLFIQYELHRRPMIAKWKKHELFYGEASESVRRMELCQAYLYRLVHAQIALHEFRYLGFDDLLQVLKSVDRTEQFFPLHLFGLSHVSRAHYEMLRDLSPFFDIMIYSFNPCMEYWEDLKTQRETARFLKREKKRSRKVVSNVLGTVQEEVVMDHELARMELEAGQVFFEEGRDNRLLQWWGRCGRENVRLLCQLAEYDFSELYHLDTQNDSVLKRIQAMLLTRNQLLGDQLPKVSQDKSLQIVGVPTIFREVEAIRQSILRQMEEDPGLRLTDIAVLVPDMAKYRPALLSIFAQDRVIPFSLVDSSADADSHYARGILDLLELLESNLERSYCFTLFENLCFQSRFEIGAEHVRHFSRWVDSLGIFLQSEYSQFDWVQGMRRLILGRYMQGTSDYFGYCPYSDMNTADLKSLGVFIEAMDIILLAQKKIRETSGTVEFWMGFFLELLESLLSVPEQFPQEAQVRTNLVDSLRIFCLQDGIGTDKALGFPLFSEALRNMLKGISSGIGTYLTGGICIAELHPMRPVPFRIVYILGLQEGEFPRSESKTSLDLRNLKRQIGDISTAERNRYLFLEVLSVTQDKLILSYQDRDMVEGRKLLPCSVILQLKRFVEEEILSENQSFMEVSVPLLSSDSLEQYAKANWTDFPANYDSFSQRFYRESIVEEVLAPGEKQEAKHKVSLREISAFLRYPGLSILRRRAGLWLAPDPEELNISLNAEPFVPSRQLANQAIVNNLYRASKEGSYEKHLTSSIQKLSNQRLWPNGAYMLHGLEFYYSRSHNLESSLRTEINQLGDDWKALPVLAKLNVLDSVVQIRGRLEYAQIEGDHLKIFLPIPARQTQDPLSGLSRVLEPVLASLIFQAQGLTVLLLFTDGIQKLVFTRLPPREWFFKVLEDYLILDSPYLLPFCNPLTGALLKNPDSMSEEEFYRLLSVDLLVNGVTEEETLADLEVPKNAKEIVLSRYGPLWNLL